MPLLKCRRISGFTLIELLVATAVFALLLVLITTLFNNASALSSLSTKHLDADAQARLLLDRMAVDFSQMIKRRDVDYFLKSTNNPQTGNDQIALFSEVPGYYPSTNSQSPVSLVAYRVNAANNSMERLGKGLLLNGAAGGEKPLVFLPLTIAANWPQAASATTADPDYEPMGSNIFRFEYFYLLKNGTLAAAADVTSFRYVAAIGVVVAVMDPKSRILVNDTALAALAGQMGDFDATTMKPGDLENLWQKAIEKSTLPKAVIPSIRVYGRTFSLSPPPA